jgi:hypothetical protein
MEHPDLPGQPIYVRPGAVQANFRAGWREAPEPEPAPVQESQPKPSRRRRAVTTEEEPDHGTDAAEHH